MVGSTATPPRLALAVLLVAAAQAVACVGAPRRASGCGQNRDCDPGQVCIDRVCHWPCVFRADCAASEDCQDGICVPATLTTPARPLAGVVPAGGRLRGGRFTLDVQVGEALTPTRMSGGTFRLEGGATLNPAARR